MKATRKTKFAFECPQCSEVHSDNDKALEPEDGWRVEEVNDEGLTRIEPEAVTIYDYKGDGECLGETEPEYQEAWQCGECEEVYLDKDEAKECCK